MGSSEYSDVRPSPIAGSWYPGQAAELRAQVEAFLEKASAPAFSGEILALIVPHAGLVYSGLTAAHAFKTLLGSNFTRVILLSPSHQYYREPLLTSGHEAYATPLGQVPVDHDALNALRMLINVTGGPEITSVRRDREHSLEIELPFLQVVLPQGFKLVPLMLVNQSLDLANALADALSGYLLTLPPEEKTLLVASSDLSHFYPEKQANQLDKRVLNALEAMDIFELFTLNSSGRGQACGMAPILTVLRACRNLGADQLVIADYRTSADVTHDTDSVVGYGSAVITKTA
ncbi:MAG: AmmeMemoRadiSam system protein B [Anaerolineaceae bacterium]